MICCLLYRSLNPSVYTRETTFVTCCLLYRSLNRSIYKGDYFCDLLFALPFTEPFNIQGRLLLWLAVCLLFTEHFIIYKEDNFCDLLFAYHLLNPSVYTRWTTFVTCCLLTVHWTLHYIYKGDSFVTCCLPTVHWTLYFIQGRHFCDFLFAYCSLNPSLYTMETTFVTGCLLTVHWTLHYIQGKHLLWLPVCFLFTELFIIYKGDNFCDFLFTELFIIYKGDNFCDILFAYCSLNPSFYNKSTASIIPRHSNYLFMY